MTMTTAVDRHIEAVPGIRGGRPHITGTRITVADVVIMHDHLGQPPELIAGKYDLPLAAVFGALAYYHDHKVEIDHQMKQDHLNSEAFRRDHPELLQRKVDALKRA
jgi:uncharacterized protein (DUF433 family)